MANPQKENGFVGVSNEIMEALARIRIAGEAMQILWVIIRQTYGFNKKYDWISISQFHTKTGIQKPHIIRALNKLKQMNIIAQKGNSVANNGNDNPLSYCLQKDYDLWRPLPKKATLPKKVMAVAQKGNLALPKKVPTIYTLKDTLTKDTLSDIKSDSKKSEHKLIIDHWFSEYEKKFGIKYGFDGGKEGRMMKTLLSQFKYELLQLIITRFLNTPDDFIEKKIGYTISGLKVRANLIAQSIAEENNQTTKFSLGY
jgi:phage replication O-like protein O